MKNNQFFYNNNKKIMKTVRKLSLLTVAALMFGACSKDTTETLAPVTEVEKVKTSIAFTVPSMESPVLEVAETSDGSIEIKQLPATRFEGTTASAAEKAIKDLRFLQFVATSTTDLTQNAVLVNDIITVNNDGSANAEVSCELAAAAANATHVYFVANAGPGALQGISNEEQFLQQSIDYASSFKVEDGIPMVSAVYTGAIDYSSTTPISITLNRMFAAVKFDLTAGDLTSPTIKMCKVPDKAYFKAETAATSFVADYAIESGKTYYIPQNNKGTINGGTKNNRYEGEGGKAPANATYIDIAGTYDKNGVEYQATYRVYLGKNAEDSYEVLSNNAYTVSATIAGLNMNDKRVVEISRELSAGGKRANCYVVSRKGVSYSFNCEYKGNENETTNTGTLTTTAADAKVLWQTDANLIKDLKLSADKKKISFTVSDSGSEGLNLKQGASVPGNAVIALIDSDNKVLWSWHIWSTDYNVYAESGNSDTYTYADGSGTTIEMMTRNLGAYNNYKGDITSGGLMYQWGRKDPFVGAKSYTENTTFQVVYDGADTPAALDNKWNDDLSSTDLSKATYATIGKKGAISAAEAVQFPMVFAAGGVEWNSDGKQNDRWGCAEPDGMTVTKSVNDPCPYGWHVPARQTWNKTGFNTTNFLWNATDKGRSYGSVYYPASGRRDSSSGALENVGANGYSWSASPYATSGSNADFAGSLSFGSSGVNPLLNTNRSYGLPVRCARN